MNKIQLRTILFAVLLSVFTGAAQEASAKDCTQKFVGAWIGLAGDGSTQLIQPDHTIIDSLGRASQIHIKWSCDGNVFRSWLRQYCLRGDTISGWQQGRRNLYMGQYNRIRQHDTGRKAAVRLETESWLRCADDQRAILEKACMPEGYRLCSGCSHISQRPQCRQKGARLVLQQEAMRRHNRSFDGRATGVSLGPEVRGPCATAKLLIGLEAAPYRAPKMGLFRLGQSTRLRIALSCGHQV